MHFLNSYLLQYPNLFSAGLQTVFDYYGTSALPDYYGYGAASSITGRYDNASGSTGTPSPHSFENGWGNHAQDQLYSQVKNKTINTPIKKKFCGN